MIATFHFLRPWWLLALVPCALILWAIYHRVDAARTWRGIIAPHLLSFLLQGRSERRRLSPLPFIGLGWGIAVIAIAGPTWRREPAPFAEDMAAMAIVLKVTPSMLAEDVQPNRLARAVQKVHDLLKLRPGAKTSLIAYSGSAHLVMPATTDAGIIDTFAEALNPKIMPVDGDVPADALRSADIALRDAGGGSILWIADGVAPEGSSTLAEWRKGSTTAVQTLAVLPEGEELATFKRSGHPAASTVVLLTPDDADVTTLAKSARDLRDTGSEHGDRWEESGYWLTPLLAALLLSFFRRGWMAQTARPA